MIVYAAADPLASWLALQRSSVGLPVPLTDRAGLRRELARVPPAGEVTLLVSSSELTEGDGGPARLLGAVQDYSIWAEQRALRARVLLQSTARVYGAPKPGIALREADAAPADARVAELLQLEAELAARAARRNLSLVVVRLFEVLDPREQQGRLSQLLRCVREGDLAQVPGLGATRDYLDARDVVRAFAVLAALPDPGSPLSTTVNVCSGRAVSGRDLVREVIRVVRPGDEAALLAGLGPAPAQEEGESAAPWRVGNAARFVQLTGSEAGRTALRTTIEEALRSA
ncbi:MAG: NAD(P)-dependent oxidoreductase [Deltaproteobacteria bacterium]|nr:NAD(P)-dependent oxidoreductase [Deltaproteobacteria bacterium]